MNDHLNPDAVRQLLNRSLAQLDQDTLSRLRSARELALQRASAHPASRLRAWFGVRVNPAFFWRHAMATRLAGALLVACLVGGAGYYWQQTNDNGDEADIAILTDDLPINYYVN